MIVLLCILKKWKKILKKLKKEDSSLFIFFKDKKFKIELSYNLYDKEEFDEISLLFNKLFIKFNFSDKLWEIPKERIDEIIMWLDRNNIKYSLQDSAIQEIENIKNSYSRELEIYRNVKFNNSILNKDIVPYNYQLESINWRLKRNCVFDSFDAGTGKTMMNIVTVSTFYNMGLIDGIFIITLNGLEGQWIEQILEFINLYKEDDFFIINNKNKNKPFEQSYDKKIILCANHLFADVLYSYRDTQTKTRSKKHVKWGKHIPNILQLWGKKEMAIIVDESDEFKNSKAIKTKALHSVKSQFKYRYNATATPNIDHFHDIYSQVTFLDHSLIPMSEPAFKLSLAENIDTRYGLNKFKIIKYNTAKVSEFLNKIKYVYIRKLKEDLPEIATKVELEKVYFKLNVTQRELYTKIVEEELHILQEEFDKITWRLLLSKLHLMCIVFDNPCILKNKIFKNEEINKLINSWKFEFDPKFIALKSKLNLYIDSRNEKVIIFDIHPETLDELAIRFKDYNPVVIHGSLKDEKNKGVERDQKRLKFNNDSTCKLALLSALTSAGGGNWNTNCHRIIVYSCPTSAKQLEQLQNRTDRANSKENSIVELFCYSRTLDSFRVNRSMQRVNLNDKLGKRLSQEELDNLLKGVI
jgi:hypothetical protein